MPAAPSQRPGDGRDGPAVARSSPAGLALGSHRLRAALVAIVVTGTVLRFLGTRWGLPLRLHPDERVIVDGAVDMARRNSFEPDLFMRPDHFEMQVSNIAYLLYSGLIGESSVGAAFAADPPTFLLISRGITATLGGVMIVLAYLIGRRFSRATGVVAAVLFALFPPFVEHSFYATPDVPLTAAQMAVVLFAMRYLETRSWKDLVLGCAAVSLSISIKYPGAIAAVLIAAVIIIGAVSTKSWGAIVTRGIAAALAVVGILFVLSPVLFTNAAAVVEAVSDESRDTHLGADGLGWAGNLGFYTSTFTAAAGWLVIAAAAVGIYWSVRLRLKESIPLWLGAAHWVLLSALPLHWARWGLPMYVTPLLLAAIGISYSLPRLRERGPSRVVAAGLVGVASVNLLVGSMAVTARHLVTDTRLAGTEGLSALRISTDDAAYEGYTPLLPSRFRSVFDEVQVVDGRLVPGRDRIRYVVLSSSIYDRFLAQPERFPAEQEFYRLLEEETPLVTQWEPIPEPTPSGVEVVNIVRGLTYVTRAISGGLSGPMIKVYDLRPEAE